MMAAFDVLKAFRKAEIIYRHWRLIERRGAAYGANDADPNLYLKIIAQVFCPEYFPTDSVSLLAAVPVESD